VHIGSQPLKWISTGVYRYSKYRTKKNCEQYNVHGSNSAMSKAIINHSAPKSSIFMAMATHAALPLRTLMQQNIYTHAVSWDTRNLFFLFSSDYKPSAKTFRFKTRPGYDSAWQSVAAQCRPMYQPVAVYLIVVCSL